jgi:hypothetical protein
VRVQFTRDDFVGGGRDQARFLRIELSEVVVDERGGLLEDRHRADDLARHDVARSGPLTNIEMDERARRLRPVIFICGDLDFPHAVGFDAFCGAVERAAHCFPLESLRRRC